MLNDGALVLVPRMPRRVEVSRSFSYKLNTENHGGPRFESRDFFCAEKSECDLEDAADVSAALYQFCKSQVMLAVREYVKEMKEALRRAS